MTVEHLTYNGVDLYNLKVDLTCVFNPKCNVIALLMSDHFLVNVRTNCPTTFQSLFHALLSVGLNLTVKPFCRFMCAIALGSLTLSNVLKVCILHTISKAWCLGRAVHRAQLAKADPVRAITTSVNGKLIISGKV